jgi:mono/diheme cytochrome c family protein
MASQPRYDPYEESSFFPDALSARPLPAGTIPRDFAPVPSDEPPFPITLDVVHRGRERFNIYCTPCHGFAGYGDGMAARRGFQRPPASFHSDKLRAAAPAYFFDVMTNGFGAMPPYSYQVAPHDRWAIAAYIRALQISQWTAAETIPPEELRRLESGTQ